MTPNAEQTHESASDLNATIIARALGERVKDLEHDLKSLQGALKVKNDQVTRLEAENVRLKLVRTDEQLAVEVEGLRRAVGTKDRLLVESQKTIDKLKDAEAVALRRAAEAERRTASFDTTLRTMQAARDGAQGRQAVADRDAADARAELVVAQKAVQAADERAKKATEPFEKLLKLADAIVKKSASLNRNETEVKNFRKAMEEFRPAQ